MPGDGEQMPPSGQDKVPPAVAVVVVDKHPQIAVARVVDVDLHPILEMRRPKRHAHRAPPPRADNSAAPDSHTWPNAARPAADRQPSRSPSPNEITAPPAAPTEQPTAAGSNSTTNTKPARTLGPSTLLVKSLIGPSSLEILG